ncbi:MAG: DUF2283 domain-containing protein [Limisphaerales bacterium]
MKIKYFEDTDTALVELSGAEIAETRELSEDVYLDMDATGAVVGITIEHASRRGDMSEVSFLRVPSKAADQELERTQ